jgi:RNA polymerase sigma-70 factor (ECF subfamily)
MLRKRRPEINFADSTVEEEDERNYAPVQFTDWCCLPEEEYLSAEARKAMDRAVEHLPETLRIVFVLRDIEDLSIQETSQVLGLSETAVKTRLLRARLRLREELSSYYGDRLNKRSKE